MKTEIQNKLKHLKLQPIADAYCPLVGADLDEFEKLIGQRLPDDYRDFVSKYGESCFGESVVVRPIAKTPSYIGGERNLPEVMCFAGMTEDYGIFDRYNVFREQDRMPPSVVPIAYDLRGNYFCIGIDDDDHDVKRGRIYLWDSQNESPDVQDYEKAGKPIPANRLHRNLTLVAESFADFVNRLEQDAE